MNKIEITYKQKKWLDDHGGRNMEDLQIDRNGRLFVMMADGAGGKMRVYLPEKT